MYHQISDEEYRELVIAKAQKKLAQDANDWFDKIEKQYRRMKEEEYETILL